jgi:hypothetical protein
VDAPEPRGLRLSIVEFPSQDPTTAGCGFRSVRTHRQMARQLTAELKNASGGDERHDPMPAGVVTSCAFILALAGCDKLKTALHPGDDGDKRPLRLRPTSPLALLGGFEGRST